MKKTDENHIVYNHSIIYENVTRRSMSVDLSQGFNEDSI